jgi:aerobic carbon-monoxide dehydrogenase small subunit
VKDQMVTVAITVNGRRVTRTVPARLTLADFLREELGLRGTHLGCEHGVCGACTVLLNGYTARSCIIYTPQADGAEVTTIEGLSPRDGSLSPIQSALRRHHGLQCGFCTPGFVLTIHELARDNPGADEQAIRAALSGNICRCTGYQGIIAAATEVIAGADGLTQRQVSAEGGS